MFLCQQDTRQCPSHSDDIARERPVKNINKLWPRNYKILTQKIAAHRQPPSARDPKIDQLCQDFVTVYRLV